MADDFVPCRVMELPPDQQVAAARQAIKWNPWNNPLLRNIWDSVGERLRDRLRARLKKALEGDDEIEEPDAAHLALLTSKYWGIEGVRLTVGFLDNPPADLRARILDHMMAWGQRANVTFTQTSGQAQVRITRTRGQGHYSYLGTDVLMIPANRNTMNLDGFSMSTPDSEFYRVVRHETGHTLGFPHEHTRAEIVGQLDPQKTTAYFQQTQGWSALEVRQQVLTPLKPSEFTGTPHADEVSIMCYEFPAVITKDGQPIPGGGDINEADFAFAASLYPKAQAPEPPEPHPDKVKQLVIEYIGEIVSVTHEGQAASWETTQEADE